MDAFHTPVCSYQGGSTYHGMHQNFTLSGIQASHQNYPLVQQNVSQNTPLVIQNTYQLSNLNGSNQLTLPGLNAPVNILPCLNQGSNFMPFVINSGNGVSYNYNSRIIPVENSQAPHINIIPQSQTLQTQRINAGTQIVSTGQNIGKTSGKGGCNNNGRKADKTTNSSSIQVQDDREKIGSINIDIIPAIPLENIPVRKILDLSIMGCLFEIKNVKVNLQNGITCKTKFVDALKQVIGNKTLLYWFILKCEEKQISIYQNNVYIELYSVNNFKTLFDAIDEESCLPMPFITKGLGNKKNYFYINLRKGSNDRVKKLNSPIFCRVNERKKFNSRYPGIKLHCNFSENIKEFTIHVHESAISVYQCSPAYVRELITCKHVIWGFLQSWIRRVRKHFKDFFTEEEISKNLSLQQMEKRNGRTIDENENIPIYLIGYSNFYLKFDPVNSKQAIDSFSVVNFETKLVCDVIIVQYYRQFFFLNDVNSAEVLNYVVLFYDKKAGRTVSEDERSSRKNKTLVKGEKHMMVASMPENSRKTSRCLGGGSRIDLASSCSGSKFSVGNNEKETRGSYFRWHTIEEPENSVDNRECRNSSEVTEERTVVQNPQTPLVRPLLKTRTVEEINSFIEANKRLGFYRVNFDSVGKFDVGIDTRNQLKQGEFSVLLHEALEKSYSMNTLEMASSDETHDEEVISKIFKEALDKAMENKCLESFVGAIYVDLRIHFTSSTSRKIINEMINKAMKKKYPGFEGIVTGSQSAVRKLDDKSRCESLSRLLEMVKEALATENEPLDPIRKTAVESGGDSCVSLNLSGFQVPPLEEVVSNEQTNKTTAEPCTSKLTENTGSNDGSEEKENGGSETEPCLLLKEEVAEGAEPNPVGSDDLSMSKDGNADTFDKNVEFQCKTEVLDIPSDAHGGEKAEEEESAVGGSISDLCKTSNRIKTEPVDDAETNESPEDDSKKGQQEKSNAHDTGELNGSCDSGVKDKKNGSFVLDPLQLSRKMREHVMLQTKREPKRKRRKRYDSEVEIMEIRARALERLRKRSEAHPTKNTKKMKAKDVARDAGKRFGDYDETKENDSFQGNRFKKELKILLRRLEDTPEYKEYVENYGPNLQFKVRKVKFKNKDRRESFKIVGIKSL